MAKITGGGAPFETLVATPRYGENPQQGNAGFYADKDNQDPLAISRFELLQGAAPSRTNYTDIDRLLQTITHIAAVFERNHGEVPAIALGAKHGNVCGAAVSSDPEQAIKEMLNGDPKAIFGGSVMFNFPLSEASANVLMHSGLKSGKRLLDVVVAAEVSDTALETLQRKEGKLRVLANPALGDLHEKSLDTGEHFRHVRGGVLTQDNYTFVLDHSAASIERPGLPVTPEQERDMSLAWAIGSTSNSNTISLVKDGMLIGNGVGQQDRVSAAELAIKRANDAGHDIAGSTAYSDSFFPFPDGPEALAKAGVKAIFASRGSRKDGEVFEAIEKAGVALETIPDAEGRGFYGH